MGFDQTLATIKTIQNSPTSNSWRDGFGKVIKKGKKNVTKNNFFFSYLFHYGKYNKKFKIEYISIIFLVI